LTRADLCPIGAVGAVPSLEIVAVASYFDPDRAGNRGTGNCLRIAARRVAPLEVQRIVGREKYAGEHRARGVVIAEHHTRRRTGFDTRDLRGEIPITYQAVGAELELVGGAANAVAAAGNAVNAVRKSGRSGSAGRADVDSRQDVIVRVDDCDVIEDARAKRAVVARGHRQSGLDDRTHRNALRVADLDPIDVIVAIIRTEHIAVAIEVQPNGAIGNRYGCGVREPPVAAAPLEADRVSLLENSREGRIRAGVVAEHEAGLAAVRDGVDFGEDIAVVGEILAGKIELIRSVANAGATAIKCPFPPVKRGRAGHTGRADIPPTKLAPPGVRLL